MTEPITPATRALAERHAELSATLAAAMERAGTAPMPPAERDQLKEDIIGLFRDVDAALQEMQALKDNVKQLATRWKHLGLAIDAAAAINAVPAAPIARGGYVPLRVDHLGASTFIEKGWSKLSLGDAPGAEATLRKALQLAPGHAEAETLLGWALMQQDQLDGATQHLHAVLLREPPNALARATLGAVCLRRGEWSAAIEHLGQALRTDKDRRATLYAHLYLGQAYTAREQFDDAEGYLLKALELGPNLLQARYELGWTYWLAGRPGDAVLAWRAGAEANKFSPWGKRCAEVLREVEQDGAPGRH